MAVLITTEKIVKTIRPENSREFNLDELNEKVGGWIDPFKVGFIWVMQRENAKEAGLERNELASYFFEMALYGDIMIVPGSQLPIEWEVQTEEDTIWPADMVDSGFLLSLKNATEMRQYSTDWAEKNHIIPKEEYVYSPGEDVPVNDELAKFLNQSFEFIKSSPVQFRRGIILEDDETIIRTPAGSRKTILNIMLNYFLEKEEYEKCAEIQKLEELIENG